MYMMVYKHLIDQASQEQLSDFLCSEFPWAKSYVYYYVYVIYAIRGSIIPVLQSISETDKNDFTPKKAYEYLRKYEMKQLSFATIIPTCNRPDAIQFILDYAAVLYRRLGIDLIVYDSSDDDRTQEVVKRMQNFGYWNVKYKRYNGIFDGFSLDHKIISAYQTFCDEYEYLWICRDGLVPVVDEMREKLLYYTRRKVDCIIIDTKSRTGGVEIEREYKPSDYNDLLIEQATRLQTLGMLIFSRSFIKRIIDSEPITDKNYSLWQMAVPFHAFAKSDTKIVFFTRNVFAPNYKASINHFWSRADKALEQWAYRWYNVIANLPDEYNDVKEQCMMVYTVDFHPFTFKTVMEMRAFGGLTYGMVKKYAFYLQKVTKTPLSYFYFVSLMPRFFAKSILKIQRKHPFFLEKIKRMVIKS